MWKHLRSVGWPIISTWIDEAGLGETADFNDLWQRCLDESYSCQVFLLYKEPAEILKGAWIELGAAFIGEARILAVGIEEFTVAKFKRVEHFPSVMDALFTTKYNK